MSGVDARYLGHRTHPDAIRAVTGAGPGGAAEDLDARARRVLAAARVLVGVRTGALLASIRLERGHTAAGPYIDVVAGVPGLTEYLGFHHDGTAPHVIRPRRRRALRFIGRGGQVVFATRVNHPGTVGTKFLQRALRAAG